MSRSTPASGSRERPAGQLEDIGQRMQAAFTSVRVWSLSLHDEHGDVLWLNESVMGPDEHEAVRAALEVFAGASTQTRHECDLGDGRVGVALRASDSAGSTIGLALIVVDAKTIANSTLRNATDPFAAVNDLVLELAAWLSDDVSATQTRLRALQIPSPPPPDEPAAEAATPDVAASSTPATTPATLVDPGLDRHFAALRALPLLLYAQRLHPLKLGSRVARYELLLRTASEHGRSQAPKAMLDAAVKRGLGSVTDRRVVTELVTWLVRNPDAWRQNPIICSINLSPTSLLDDHFLKFLELCLAKASLPRGMLAFELDAALCQQRIVRAAHVCQVLAALGCTIILDDFSHREGHMELLSLKGVRMLKLDPQLTTDLASDKRRQAIVAGLAQTARILGMHTVAKRVEGKTEQRWLEALRIDFAQGYAFTAPEPLAALLGTDAAAATPAPPASAPSVAPSPVAATPVAASARVAPRPVAKPVESQPVAAKSTASAAAAADESVMLTPEEIEMTLMATIDALGVADPKSLDDTDIAPVAPDLQLLNP